MLKPAPLRRDSNGRAGAGSFNPKNEGPLMEAGASVAGSGRGGSGWRGGSALRGREVEAGAEGLVCPDDATCCGCALAASKVPPHIPQKRFPSGFSLPQ